MVLIPRELKVARSLGKVLRNRDYEVRADTDFRRVDRGVRRTARGPGRHLDQRRNDRRVLRAA